ncbi:TlpA family protein disulfide reductase [Flavobacterium chungangense]|uniref:Thiol-disulfide oxidoreductase ResA n=1 Tax=Flavobacterium chungangense TaxID=554283 RepID=A0A6V6YZ58_9FLAO|nr:TlpA disulfide reductase family protein [Flavobacterium chungangense]CAD0004705.1 Thiol-disulfide oxidoreductase ResA [Flavobacterium chungangense]
MKKYIVVVMLTLFWSCKNETDTKVYTILSGKIKNSTAKDFSVMSSGGFSKKIKIKNNGSFADTLDIDTGVYNLYTDQNFTPIYFKKGANVGLVIDEKNADSPFVFSGDEADLNNYYASKTKKETSFSANDNKLFSLPEAAFVDQINSHQKELEKNLDTYKNIPEEIKKSELRSLNYNRLLKKLIYKNTNTNNNVVTQTSKDFNKEIIDINLNSGDDYFYSSDYRGIVNQIVYEKAQEISTKDEVFYFQAFVRASGEITNEKVKNELLYSNILSSLPASTTKKIDLDKFLSLSTNKKHHKEVKELYNTVAKLDKGKPSPVFKNYENFDGSTTSLNHLRGKYVYIDVWATWCGPCKREIPYLKKFEKQYEGKNIVFVSISVDAQKDKQKWKEMVKKNALKGIQLITDNEFNTEFIKGYQITGIPRFIILDPKGNIIDANAIRPSDEVNLKAFFDKLNLASL